MTGAVIRLLLFLLPFVLFYFWLKLAKGKKHEDGLDPVVERNLKIGIAAAAALFAFAVYKTVTAGEGTTELKYIPPNASEEGIKPGHFEQGQARDETAEKDDGDNN